jgi:rhodanese-related sulfurtransferase
VSGHGRLALEHGVPVSIHPTAGADYPHEAYEDGAEIEVGEVVLRCIHTPGHRPEHCAIAVVDRSRGEEPWLVLTGDSLFVGDVARPDLAVDAREGAEDLFHSLRRLLELEDGVETYPGHVAGSLCGKGMSSKGSTTIGFERRFNRALAADDVSSFVADSAAVTAPKPPNVERIVDLNRGPFVGAQPFPDGMDEVADGMQILDVRLVEDFAAGHRTGAVCVPVSGTRFSTKAGFAIDLERPVVVAASSDAEVAHAVRGLHAIGVFDVAGHVDAAGPETLELVSVEELDALLDNGAELIDVREKDERADGYIAGSRNIPYRLLALSEDDLPRDRTLVTICETGPRAAIAASILAAHGFDAHPVVDGGIDQWIDAGKPTVTFRRCGS